MIYNNKLMLYNRNPIKVLVIIHSCSIFLPFLHKRTCNYPFCFHKLYIKA